MFFSVEMKLIPSVKDLYRHVTTIEFHQNIVKIANERNDKWGRDVLLRLDSCIDLVAAEGIYHRDCAVIFRKEEKHTEKSRPIDSKMSEAFEKLCQWLEDSGDCEISTLNELHKKMTDENETVYSLNRFRQEIKERYEDHAYFVASEGCKGELVCFWRMADYILRKMVNFRKTT